MPRVQRSPVNLQNTSELLRTHSDSDLIHSQLESTSDNTDVTAPNKRRRTESHTKSQTQLQLMMETFINKQESMMTKMMTEISELKEQNIKIQKSVDNMTDNLINIQQKIKALDEGHQSVLKRVITLEKSVIECQNISRPSTIEIRNVHFKENESTNDLQAAVLNMTNELNVIIKKEDIRDVYRMPGKPGANKPVVVEFQSVSLRNHILSAVKEYNKKHVPENRLCTLHMQINGPRIPIYVDEHLNSSSRKLFFQAREFAKKHDYKFCWVKHGKIYLRKEDKGIHIMVKTENQLNEIEPK